MLEEHFECEGFSKFIVFSDLEVSHNLKMLAVNQMDRVLLHELRIINGRHALYYHIEGSQPVSVVFDRKEWDYVTLKKLYRGICTCIAMLREYLLPYDALLLDAEHIFWNWQRDDAGFLVVPDCSSPIADQITALTEYLMQHVNYQDKRASDWLYGLYDALRKQGVSYELLCEYCEQEKKEETRPSIAAEYAPLHDPETEKALQEMYYLEESKWSKLFNRCRDFLGDYLPWLKGKKPEPDKTNTEFQPVFCDHIEELNMDASLDSDSSVELDTALLVQDEMLIRLKPLDAGYPCLVPQKERTLVGRQEDSCNFVIRSRDVSRVHASIVLRDDEMIVTDLNSSNGTYVNQKRLDIKEDVVVKRGDEVRFGGVKYVAV